MIGIDDKEKIVCKPASTSLDSNVRLGKVEEDVAVDMEMYQCL